MASTDFWSKAPPDIKALMTSMWADIQRSSHKRQVEQAKADPAANKLTRNFDSGVSTSYRYWKAGKDGKGREVRFCFSSHRNAAGYFLGWREVIGKKQTARDQWIARKVKQRCKEISKRRADAFRAKHSPTTRL